MKNKQAIEIIKDIAGQHNNSAEKRAFEKGKCYAKTHEMQKSLPLPADIGIFAC